MALPIKTILQEKAITSATRWFKKKIGVNETAICESIFRAGHLSNMSDL